MKTGEKKRELLDRIGKALEQDGVFRMETCDCDIYGWCRSTHDAMVSLSKQGIAGCTIRSTYRHEVHEWTVMRVEKGPASLESKPVVIRIDVRGGVAYAPEESELPEGIQVEIIDHDNREEKP